MFWSHCQVTKDTSIEADGLMLDDILALARTVSPPSTSFALCDIAKAHKDPRLLHARKAFDLVKAVDTLLPLAHDLRPLGPFLEEALGAEVDYQASQQRIRESVAGERAARKEDIDKRNGCRKGVCRAIDALTSAYDMNKWSIYAKEVSDVVTQIAQLIKDEAPADKSCGRLRRHARCHSVFSRLVYDMNS